MQFPAAMENEKPRIVVIAGPTASGKTAVGIELAEKLDGEIVSADSIQIYRFMNIGSAKPTVRERSRVPHHLVDICDPDENFSAGDYVRVARECIRGILERGRVPLVVGGTGLYIRLLLGGIAKMPPAQPRLRKQLRAEELQKGQSTLFRRLAEVDPETAAVTQPSNLSRIIRSLEVFESTGKKISEIQKEHALQDRPYRTLFLSLDPGRSVLYERIDNRVDNMIKGGLLDEVAALYARGYRRELKSMQSLGYRHAGMILSGEVDTPEAVGLMKRDTRRYAKRQFTWFRSEPEVLWIGPEQREDVGSVVDNFLGR
ncbi:MAG TPA: tRNA (adenosine(37)-N6)-dimethylallyltransferase MiaA [Desulfomonilaceae bacterium]|nr:tRNA (adenosine(37)-N6)-dimethylallyltransferase MiaA [Desulfomonilaceae bacterium]